MIYYVSDWLFTKNVNIYPSRYSLQHPKELLAAYGLKPKKSLGQNFLFDENLLARLVETAVIHPTDHVLEIGPGLGSLTHLLARRAAQVVTVELDERLLPILQGQLALYDNVRLIHGDILKQQPAELFQQPYKVVANVPYYITGAILRHLLTAVHKPTSLTMTVQQEVAERITAVPSNMSLLAVSVQFYGQATIVDTIKAGAFWPRPDVDSAVVHIDLTQPAPTGVPLAQEQAFMRLVKVGFAQKRKQLQKNLRALSMSREAIDAALQAAAIDGRRRAETLTLAEWGALFWEVSSGK
jgi:16S rRNA (adenine1518-N6/adenine1519-N6)-dimethyltransferase